MFIRRMVIAAVGVVAAVGAASPADAGQGVGFSGSFDGRTYSVCHDETAVFAATTMTGAGPLEVRLVGTDFTYTISPYTDPFGGGFVCASVVYTGQAG